MLSEAIIERLKDYLQFRHVFRHIYTFHLRWDRMESLVRNLPTTQRDVDREVRAFLEAR